MQTERFKNQNMRKSPSIEISRSLTKKKVSKLVFNKILNTRIKLQLSFAKNESLFSAASVLLGRPKLTAYNNTSLQDKLTCNNFVDSVKGQHRIGNLSWSLSDSDFLDIKLNIFRQNDNRDISLVQNLTMN